MTTRRLLWGMTWRGGVWGLLVGSLLGVIYGVFFAEILVLVAHDQHDYYILTPDKIGGGWSAIFFVALMGVILGAIFGVPTGLVVGLSNGLLIGIVTRLSASPLGDLQKYRWMIALVSIAFTAPASVLCFIVIFSLYFRFGVPLDPLLISMVTLPALIAALAAGFTSRLVARWYERESIKGIAQNVSAN